MRRVRRCVECNRDFVPSSRHLRCPGCRSWDRCDCGRRKQAKADSCLGCSRQDLAYNGNWKGGLHRHKAGYIMIRTPEHPRAAGNHGYVFEHILVMENKLGRHLLADETVHHVNGVRDDNRPENLELWVRGQPNGISAADAVGWAK